MAKRRFGLLILALCLCLCLVPTSVQAASTEDATQPIDPQAECNLTIRYSCDGQAFSGQQVTLYRVAAVSADYQYTLTPEFEASGQILNGIRTNGEWDTIRSTLAVYLLASTPAPVATAETDAAGVATFSGLKPGLYLTPAVYVARQEGDCAFDAALIALPGLDAEGQWQYTQAVSAKPALLPPVEEDDTLQVIKAWRGDEGSAARPQYVEVEIFRDGVSYATVVLSAENNWSYAWPAGDGVWQVAERNVPQGYTATVTQREATFVITNTRIPENPPETPPETGDSTPLMLYVVILFVSGLLLLLLGLLGKRKRHG